MASVGSHLPLWDRHNPTQEDVILGTQLDELLIQATTRLKKQLKLTDIWAHLQALGVLTLMDVERIQHNRARPDQVEALIKHLRTGGTRWMYHALLRAMALTGQGHLIPGTHTAGYYTEAAVCQHDRFTFTPQQLKGIWDHCLSCKKLLMLSHVFNFEGDSRDSGDDIINLADSIIKIQPNVKDVASQLKHGEMLKIAGSKLLEPLGDSPPPVTIRIYADPGDGKTTFARYAVYSWSINFLKHLLEKDGKLCLKSGYPEWKMMVFLCARDIKTTIKDAIRDVLGCKKGDEDVLMDLIEEGKWVAVFMDAYDEVRNPETIKKIHDYVQECQRKGGPTVVITCRTDLCNIDGKYFDRFVTLPGFTDEEGLRYIQRYTELCQPLLPQPSQAPSVYGYANQHKDKLKAVLCNPLKLHIFTALALRGQIDLSIRGDFNISGLFEPLEQYLLGREGVEVTEAQSHAFYRLCAYALLNDIREFPDTLLQEFNIIKAYHVFMVKSDRRNNTGKLQSFYAFGHEMVLEYFASRYIFNINDKDQISFLLFICCDRQLRNVQKIVFELLLQAGNAQLKALQTMVRLILILQCPAPDLTLLDQIRFRTLYDLVHLPDNIKTDVPIRDILRSQHGRINIKNAASIHAKVNMAFDSHADTLRRFGWFTCLRKDGTLGHVVGCLRDCSHDVQEELTRDSIHRLLPCSAEELSSVSWWYAAGATRWTQVEEYKDWDHVSLHTWCPGDAAHALLQHAATPAGRSSKEVHKLNIYTDQYSDKWGEPGEGRFTHEEWDKLLQVVPQGWGTGLMWVYLHYTTPVTGLLTCLTHHAAHLAQCGRVEVWYGTAHLEDLVTCVSRCLQAGLGVVLWNTHIVVPERLRAQRDKLHQLKDALRGVVEEGCRAPRWMTDTGDKYVWSDESDEF